MTDSAEAALLGRRIAGKFLIESLIGVGAMGAVYKARQVTLDKTIAVKVMHPDRARDAMYAALFQREARAASRLDHPNSVRVVDFGQEPDGLLYIAMEYFAGRDLLRVLSDDWPLPAGRIADILAQALAAIAVAHDMGMVHRDLKPENILVQMGTDDEGTARDVVKVCDFGIAKFTEPSDTQSSRGGKRLTEGVVIGTPHYMSPEQGQGEALDPRTDLYSMGIILYQMLTARVPFEGKTLVEVVVKHVRDEPVPPSKTAPWVDRRLEAICLKALKKKRTERYQTAREMRAELRAVLADMPSSPQLPGPVSKSAATLPPPKERASGASSSSGSSQPVKTPLQLEPSPSKVTPPPTTSTNPEKGTRAGARAALLGSGAVAVVVAAFLMMRPSRVPTPAASPISANGEVASAGPRQAAPANVPSGDLFVTLPPLSALAQQPAPKDLPPKDVSKSKVVARTAHKKDSPQAPEAPEAARAEPVEQPAALAPPPVAAPPPPAVAPTPPATPPPLAPPAPTTAPPTPAARPFDPARGRVDWSVGATGGGATASEVRRALARVSGAWSGCYQNALRSAGQRMEGVGTLRITTDDDGNVVQARLSGFGLAGVGACIAASSNVHIDGVDTGSAWADVKLTFRVESTE